MDFLIFYLWLIFLLKLIFLWSVPEINFSLECILKNIFFNSLASVNTGMYHLEYCLCVCLTLSVSNFLSVYMPINLSVCLYGWWTMSVHLSICQSMNALHQIIILCSLLFIQVNRKRISQCTNRRSAHSLGYCFVALNNLVPFIENKL